jgi:hypothetical protein
MSAQHKWIKPLRLVLAFLSTPVVTLIWLSISFDLVTWHYHTDRDGTDLVMLLLLPPVLPTLLSALVLGYPYVLFMSADNHLNFRTIMLPTALVALASGLTIYASTRSLGYSFALAFGALFMFGGIVSGLCFYFIGAWRMVQRDNGSKEATETSVSCKCS